MFGRYYCSLCLKHIFNATGLTDQELSDLGQEFMDHGDYYCKECLIEKASD